jgi:hypothetical protein
VIDYRTTVVVDLLLRPAETAAIIISRTRSPPTASQTGLVYHVVVLSVVVTSTLTGGSCKAASGLAEASSSAVADANNLLANRIITS